MLTIIPAQTDEQLQQFQDLIAEYIAWDQVMSRQVGLDVDQLIAAHYSAPISEMIADCAPPAGRMLLVSDGGQMGGCVGLRPLSNDVGEVKRLYVRPGLRGRGAGRALLQALIAETRQIGYTTLRLETAKFMTDAHKLYYSAGFRDIEAYDDVPEEFKTIDLFMELKLS